MYSTRSEGHTVVLKIKSSGMLICHWESSFSDPLKYGYLPNYTASDLVVLHLQMYSTFKNNSTYTPKDTLGTAYLCQFILTNSSATHGH